MMVNLKALIMKKSPLQPTYLLKERLHCVSLVNPIKSIIIDLMDLADTALNGPHLKQFKSKTIKYQSSKSRSKRVANLLKNTVGVVKSNSDHR